MHFLIIEYKYSILPSSVFKYIYICKYNLLLKKYDNITTFISIFEHFWKILKCRLRYRKPSKELVKSFVGMF